MRTLHLANPPMHGPDVEKLQALLTVKGFPCTVDGVFGGETATQCVEAKRRLKYPRPEQLPIAGPRLIAKLAAHPPFPPAQLRKPRVRYVAELRAALRDSGNWDYAQIRPIPHPGHVGRIVTDCSGGVTYLAECAGIPDPNGRRFDGLGYTGTLLDHCQRISRPALEPGDLVVFGAYPGHHVCAVLDAGPDPLLWSHGRQGDPRAIVLSLEEHAQAQAGHGTVTYLRFLP